MSDPPPNNGTDVGPGVNTVTDSHPFVQMKGLINGAWFVFFVVSVASSKLGGFARHVGMPLITGYMFIGVLCGPYLLEMVHDYQIPDLAYVTQTALAFIAFSAGSELYLPELRSLFKPILSLTVSTSAIVYLVCAFTIFAMSSSNALMGWMNDYGYNCRLMISLTIGSIMVARSPASAIAVVRELNAHGPLTSCMLGVTVVGDVVVLILFTLSSSLALAVCAGDGFKGAEFLLTILSLAAAVAFGYAAGYLFIFLLWMPRAPWARYTILPIGLFIFILCDWFDLYSSKEWGVAINFDALLICITAGYVVTNQSQNRISFMLMLSEWGPMVFVPFFTKVGVELNLTVLWQSIGFAIIVFFVRAACMFIGGWSGGKVGALSNEHCYLVWLTMLSQAGVSLGLASEIAVKFQSSFGPDFQTAVVAVVIINQLVGPVLCKYAIKRARENEQTGEDGMPLGLDGETQAPDLQLSYEQEDLSVDGLDESTTNIPPHGASGASTTTTGTGISPQHMQSQHHRKSTAGLSNVFSSTHVMNIHGQRMRKATRKRALILGCSSASLTAAQRLLDADGGNEWSILLLDESLEGVARAAAFLGTSSTAKLAREAVFDPLPSLLRKMSQLASKTREGMESGLDHLLPVLPEERYTDQDRLMGGGTNATGKGKGKGKGKDNKHPRTSSVSSLGATTDDATGPVRIHASGSVDEGSSHNAGGAGVEMKASDEFDDVDIDEDHSLEVEHGSTSPLEIPSDSPEPVGSRPMILVPTSPDDTSSSGGGGGTNAGDFTVHVSPGLHHSSIVGGSSTTTTPSSKSAASSRVQVHRLSLDNHRTFLSAYRAIEEEFFLSREGIDAVLIDLHMDSVAYDIAAYLTDKRRFNRVVARVKHPAWARVLAGLGVTPIYSLSIESQLVSQLLSGGAEEIKSSVSFVSAASSSNAGVSDLVASTVLAEDDLACALQDLDSHHRSEYLRTHPPPPPHLAGEAQKRSMSRPHFLSVVSEAHREGYVDAIGRLHSTMIGGSSSGGAGESDHEREQRSNDDGLNFGGLSQLRHQQAKQRTASTAGMLGAMPSSARAASTTSALQRRSSTNDDSLI